MELLDASPDSTLLLDRSYVVLACNRAMAFRLGKHFTEIVGRPVFDFLPNEIAETRRAKLDEAVQTGRTVRFRDERYGLIFDNTIVPIPDASGDDLPDVVKERAAADGLNVTRLQAHLPRHVAGVQRHSPAVSRSVAVAGVDRPGEHQDDPLGMLVLVGEVLEENERPDAGEQLVRRDGLGEEVGHARPLGAGTVVPGPLAGQHDDGQETHRRVLPNLLEDRVVKRVGDNKETPVDVRILALSNSDLEAAVAHRAFSRGPLLPPRRHHAPDSAPA